MRRFPLLAAAIAVLLPTTLLSTTGSASAAAGKLTVKTYDRAGKVFKTQVRIMNNTTLQTVTVNSFTAKSLAKGTYTVFTDIYNPHDGTDSLGTDTLGAQIVTVPAKSVSITFDARKGKAVDVRLDRGPGDGYEQTVRAAICPGDTGAVAEIEAWNHPGRLFVIPNSSKQLRFAYSSVWQNYAGGDAWIAAGSVTTSVPAGVRTTVKAASLATVTAVARRGPAGGTDNSFRLVEQASCRPGYGVEAANGPTPQVARIHATPGKWQLEADWSGTETNGGSASIGFDWRKLTLAAGKTYGKTFFASAWGPGFHVPEMTGKRLYFSTDKMFSDPAAPDMFEASQKSLVTLTGSKNVLIKRQWRNGWGDNGDAGFTANITKAGWYIMQVNATRYRPGLVYPSGMLSPSAQAIFRMRLDPKAKPHLVDTLLPRMVPAGLNRLNQAPAGGTTVVQIKPERGTWNPDVKVGTATAKSVTLQVSSDGKSWKSMPVRKSGSVWLATVTNPASGPVWLRSRVTSTSGAYAQVTIARAYAVQ
ncbi:hypothetical protein [Actinoplanes regularis]|uniref:hypothetical protein n=1 Tax=Actinoplanes regularis TaxID=52697 RepID=UPI0024A5A3C1|nr:hypothetical protein [Actinoplanes regularis]GLW30037.1 hypothetical protein Areg01_29770 [Actinoplanes regularis]